MNKRSLRSFSLGMLVATTIFFVGVQFFSEKEVVSEKEWLEMEKKLAAAEAKLEELTVEKEEPEEERADEGDGATSEDDIEKPATDKNDDIEKPATDENDDVSTEDTVEKPATDEPLYYELEIKGGMTSEDVVDILAKEHIVDDEDAFSQFLEEHGYNRRIQLGTFELNNEMTYEEISRIITKS